jgi:hypothetical protein
MLCVIGCGSHGVVGEVGLMSLGSVVECRIIGDDLVLVRF